MQTNQLKYFYSKKYLNKLQQKNMRNTVIDPFKQEPVL